MRLSTLLRFAKRLGPSRGFVGRRRGQRCFFERLTAFICESPIVCLATVIGRVGYRTKYDPLYEPGKRWLLCKTAFSILVERSVKYASSKNLRLRVFIEQSDKRTDRTLETYYDQLGKTGMFFAEPNMAAYAPVRADDFRNTLYGFRKKTKPRP